MKKSARAAAFTVIAVFLLACFAAADYAGAGPPNCVTAQCHPKMGKEKHVHGPVASGDCTTCHQPTGKAHPAEKGAFKLADTGAKLCSMCHESKSSKKHVHSAIASGSCTDCHDPHQSPNKMQLKEAGAALCFMCHEKQSPKYGHGPVAMGECTACHDPHQSDNKNQLKLADGKLCFSCHDSAKFSGKSIHEPVRTGACTSCHKPHGSDFPHLLGKNYPDELYLPYRPENFALCFDCHGYDLAMDRRTDTLTNFRNGDRNLHYTHVNNPVKGRTCRVCHQAHVNSQAKLINEKLAGFGNWEIPINFTKTDTGGTCVVGCHKPQSYDRTKPVQY